MLCSSRPENIRLAGEMMERSAAEASEPDYPAGDRDDAPLLYKVAYPKALMLVLSSAQEYFNSSASLTDSCMELARYVACSSSSSSLCSSSLSPSSSVSSSFSVSLSPSYRVSSSSVSSSYFSSSLSRSSCVSSASVSSSCSSFFLSHSFLPSFSVSSFYSPPTFSRQIYIPPTLLTLSILTVWFRLYPILCLL